MRTIHYGIRFALVLVVALLFYLGLALLFRQAVQPPALIMLLFITFVTERMWVLLEWVGPVIGTMNKKQREQEQKQVVEYLLECSLRYDTPLVIAAIHGKKRVSRHVLSRFLRKSDIVVRTTAGYLLAVMPFTTLEQALVPLKRIAARLPVKEVVVSDVNMLQALLEMLGTRDDDGAYKTDDATSRELRSVCFRAFDARLATIKSSAVKGGIPAIYQLYEPGFSETLSGWLAAFDPGGPAENALPSRKDERAEGASLS